MQECRIAVIGAGFMTEAHLNAWRQANTFGVKSDPALTVKAVLKTVCSRTESKALWMRDRFGCEFANTDWRSVVKDPNIDLVDICVPNVDHAEIAIAALGAGKHVLCEKPIALNLEQAKAMVSAAKNAPSKLALVSHNYRCIPAMVLARRMAQEGFLGRVFEKMHRYPQEWGQGPGDIGWRQQIGIAGSGSLGDLAAHPIDADYYITGDPITKIMGAMMCTFIKERPIPGSTTGGLGATTTGGATESVKVDDVTHFLAYSRSGAVVNASASRFTTGKYNDWSIGLYGDKGAFEFNFEDMNRLRTYDTRAAKPGWTTLDVTDKTDPYMDMWWPRGHIIGYEHTFTNQATDILRKLGGQQTVGFLCSFWQAQGTQSVLHSVTACAKDQCPQMVEQFE